MQAGAPSPVGTTEKFANESLRHGTTAATSPIRPRALKIRFALMLNPPHFPKVKGEKNEFFCYCIALGLAQTGLMCSGSENGRNV